MINEEEFVQYFENLAISSKEINHSMEGKKAFFYVEDAYDLAEFDQALRNAAQSPSLMLVADNGTFNDNNTANHTQLIDFQLLVISRKKTGTTIRGIRSMCLQIALNFLVRIKQDAKQGKIFNNPKRRVDFRINQIPYNKVGPMNGDWYGYAVDLGFSCPFGYSINSGTWRDIDTPPPADDGYGELPLGLA